MSKRKKSKAVRELEFGQEVSEVDAAEEMKKRERELAAKVAEAESKIQRFDPEHEDAHDDTSHRLHDLESRVDEIDGELRNILAEVPEEKKKRKRQGLKAKAKQKRAARKERRKVVSDDVIHASPNTVAQVKLLEEQSRAQIPEGQEVKFVWALVFDMPLETRTIKEQVVDDDVDEDKQLEDMDVDDLEKRLGYDLDGDGDIGTEGTQVEGSLKVSHEAWMACEKIVAADLVLQHAIPIDQRYLIVAIGARHDVLVDEASYTKMLMRLQESKGSLPFHEDLIKYYACNHGGLNEYSNKVWVRRGGSQLPKHFTADEDLDPRDLEERATNALKVFTSGSAQRLVMNRLNRKARYSPEHQLSVASKTKGSSALGSSTGPHVSQAKRIRSRCQSGHHAHGRGQRAITAQILHELLITYGAYRPQSANVFPKSPTDEAIVSKMCDSIIRDDQFVLSSKGFSSHKAGEGLEVTYEMILECLDSLEKWRDPVSGPGREEVWYGTIHSYFPLHDTREMEFLRTEWGTPKILIRSVIVGYDPEGDAAVYDPGPPKMFEHNTFGASGNILHEHQFPTAVLYQPLEEIRDYFGDDVGLYYTWLGLYTRMLFLQALFGTMTMYFQLSYGSVTNNPATFSYSIYVGMWSISFLEAWHRRENELRFLWGTEHLSTIEQPRPQFEGELKTHPETGRQVLDYKDPTRQALKKVATTTGVFVFIVITIMSALGAQVVRYIEPVDPQTIFEEKKYELLSSFLNLLIIGIFGQLFERLAERLCEWENHRTQSEFENALVGKNFVFQFVNNYFVLFYIAFLREVKDPVTRKSHPCEGGNCLPVLQTQLIVVFTGKTLAKQVAFTLKPFIFKAKERIAANRHTKHLVKAVAAGQAIIPAEMASAMREVVATAGGRDDPLQQLKYLRNIRNPYELQSRLMPCEGTFDDFNDRVIQFGYLVLFAPAYSLAPLLAFINNVIEIRTSGFKMCYAYQRPVWKPKSGIGAWMVWLNVLGFLAVITNAAMITFVGSQDAESLGLMCKDKHDDPGDGSFSSDCTDGFFARTQEYPLWIRFFIVESSVMAMRSVILVLSPSMPVWLNEAREVLEYRIMYRYRTNADIAAERRVQEQYEKKMNDGFAVMKKVIAFRTKVQMRTMFELVDKDGSESLDPQQLGAFFVLLGVHMSDKELHVAIADIDDSGDMLVEFEELIEWLTEKGIWDEAFADSHAANYVDKSYEATEMHALEHSEVEVAASPRAAGGVSSPFQPMYAGSNDEAATTSYDDAAEEMAAVRIQATVRGQQARARAGGGGAADLL